MGKKDKKILYLGLDPSRYVFEGSLAHCPLIKIIPCSLKKKEVALSFQKFDLFTHLIFTSRSTVSILLNLCREKKISWDRISKKKILAVGKGTEALLTQEGLSPDFVASPETAEGIIKLFEQIELKEAHLFLPHSSLARSVLNRYMKKKKIIYTSCVLYFTRFCKPKSLPDINSFDEIVFTSPSTVEAFCRIYGTFPQHVELIPIGPITAKKIISKKREVAYRESLN